MGAESEHLATLLQKSPFPAGYAGVSRAFAMCFFRGVPGGPELFRIPLYTLKGPDFPISVTSGPGFKMYVPTTNQLPPPLTASPSLHVSSHWPHSEQSPTNTGLAHGTCLFPGFPSGLTSIQCPAAILLNPEGITSLSAQKLPGGLPLLPDQVQQRQLRVSSDFLKCCFRC